MSQTSTITGMVAGLLRGEGGLQANINAVAADETAPAPSVTSGQIITQNLPVEIAERSTSATYPCIQVYCEKAANKLREKFRRFSGDSSMTIEVRVSSDRVEDVDTQINVLVDAVTGTLEQNRGDWGGGVFYGGAYQIEYGGVKRGGKNFLQTAKVKFDLQISSS